MEKQKRVLAIHDISCVGRCSLTVALPILAAAGDTPSKVRVFGGESAVSSARYADIASWLGMDGYEVCQRIRKNHNTPIIMLSAKGEVFDKVLGLKMGADDYIMKPFDSNELVARVYAVLRRSAAPQTEDDDDENKPIGKVNYDRDGEFVEYDNLIINISHYTVTLEGHHVEMPPKELELLYFMASRPNQVFTREQLLNQLWGYEFMGDTRTVDVHVKRLREKLSDKYNWTIATVWRIGYKFEVR